MKKSPEERLVSLVLFEEPAAIQEQLEKSWKII